MIRRSNIAIGNFSIDADAVIKKWRPILETYFTRRNAFLDLLSLYCEWYTIANPSEIGKLEDKLTNIDEITRDVRFKKTVVERCFNVLTGEPEYLLEDGTYYNKSYLHLTLDELVFIFGDEFIKWVNLTDYRDDTLIKVLR